MLPTDLSASIGLVQLDRLKEMQAKRQYIWDTYQAAFSKQNFFKIPSNPNEGDSHSYFTYLIRAPRRDELAHYLFDNGIYTTLRYHPLHLNDMYKQERVLPVTEALNETGLNIPLHPLLKDEEVELVISKIFEFYGLQG